MHNLAKLTEENDHLKKEIELSNIEDYQTISRYVTKQMEILFHLEEGCRGCDNPIKGWLVSEIVSLFGEYEGNFGNFQNFYNTIDEKAVVDLKKIALASLSSKIALEYPTGKKIPFDIIKNIKKKKKELKDSIQDLEKKEEIILVLNPDEIAKKLGVNVKDTMAEEIMYWHSTGLGYELFLDDVFSTLMGYLKPIYTKTVKYELESSLIYFLNNNLDIYPKEDHKIIMDYIFRPESLNNWNNLNNEIQILLNDVESVANEVMTDFEDDNQDVRENIRDGTVDWDSYCEGGYSDLKKHWTDLLKSLDETRFNTKFFNTGPNITLEELKSMYEGHPINMEEKLAAESRDVIDDDDEYEEY
jgi:hypothetical protein